MLSAASIARSRLRLGSVAPALVLLLVCLPLLTLNLGGSPPVWFDEGYKLNAARTLAERGVYGTYTVDGYLRFDPGISSGPADLLPLAASFRLFGAGVAQGRLVFVAYTLLALFALYRLATLIFGRQAGLLAAVALVAAPPIGGTGLLPIGRQVLGEAPALALILCGILLWARSWRWPGLGPPLAAGLLLGLGLLSKTQIGIALLPALLLVALGRGWPRPRQIARELIPAVVMLGIFVSWSFLGRALTDAATQRENTAMLLDAVRSNLLTGLWGRTLSRTSMAIAAVMVAAAGVSGWRLWRRRGELSSPSWWAEAFLASFVALYAIWFVLLSVGWPRYSYAGLVVALLLLAGAAGSVLQRASRRLALLQPMVWLAIGMALAGQLATITLTPASDDAQQTAAFLDATVAPDAVVETWEWQLSALGRHTAFHHPHQRYLFLAIRQFSHEQVPFYLRYDALQADPEYLVIGDFGAWTQIYRPETLEREFALVKRIGAYQIYQRRHS